MPSFKVRVTKDYTVFCAGHFITYEGDQCEALHGHNYRAAASLEGELGESFYVFDFVTLKRILRAICDRLDHRMLLPLQNPHLQLSQDDESVLIRYRDKQYVFPKDEVVLLPIPNTTAEKLAEWIGGELEADLRQRGETPSGETPSGQTPGGPQGLKAMEVEVEESFGQSAVCRWEWR